MALTSKIFSKYQNLNCFIMKAIGIARVSTKEQEEQWFSIPAQVARIKEFATVKWFPDIVIYELAESSTKDTRKQFEKIVKEIEDSEECVSLFVETIDRLQRDYKESVVLDDLRKKGKVRMFFFRENLIIDQNSNSADIMRWDIGVFVAKQYVGQLRDNVKRSIDKKLIDWEWIGKAPLGYLNVNKDDGSTSKKSEGRDCPKWIVSDPERKQFVIKAFEVFSSGLHSIQWVAKQLAKEGFTTREWQRIWKTTLHKLLRNPFYYGEMVSKGKKYPHNYEPLIPYWLFEKCQRVLEWRASNERWTQYNKKEFIFKGIIHCKACSQKLSSYSQKGINYIRCHTCNSVHEREDHFEQQIESIFQKISIPEDVMLDLVQILKETHEKEEGYTKRQQEGLIKERWKIEQKISMAYEDRLDWRITGNNYDKIVQELKKKDQDILEQLKDHSRWDEAFLITSSYILELAHRAYTLFKSSQTAQKRELINFVFANFEADGWNLLYKIKEPFWELLFCAKSSKWLPG
jgi:site-specific DNA recombinase